MKVLDLFSGIGGFSVGLERTGHFRTVAFCEIDPFCRKVLAKHWPRVPIHGDIRELSADDIGPVDIIVGGYPCQPFSAAGQRRGVEDDRHLWPEAYRLVAATRPAWCLFENVAGHVSMGLDDVLSDLEGEGYAVWPLVIPACAVDAKHRRDRVWILAHSRRPKRGALAAEGCEPDRDHAGRQETPSGTAEPPSSHGRGKTLADADGARQPQPQGREQEQRRWVGDISEHVSDTQSHRRRQRGNGRLDTSRARKPEQALSHAANPNGARLSHRGPPRQPTDEGGRGREVAFAEPERCRSAKGAVESGLGGMADGIPSWLDEPDIGRVAAGVPQRVDRLKALGNAVVPQVVTMIGHAIAEAA